MAAESNDVRRSAAIYARASLLGNEGGEGVEDQIDSARWYAEEHDLEIVEWYVDEAAPGGGVEGRGQVEAGRRPSTQSSAKATLRIVGSSDSKGFMGLFCSPESQFVLTCDIEPGHWAYVVVAQDDKFNGAGTDLRGQDLGIGELDGVCAILRVLEREGFIVLRQETDEHGC